MYELSGMNPDDLSAQQLATTVQQQLDLALRLSLGEGPIILAEKALRLRYTWCLPLERVSH